MESPSSVKMRIMPTLRPTRPRLIVCSDPGCNWPGDCDPCRSAIVRLVDPRRGAARKNENYSPRRRSEASIAEPTRWRARGEPSAAPALGLLHVDLHVDAGRQVEARQRVDRLVGGVDDVHQPLVR